MAAPQIGCSTFGSWDFIRVPAPAARMTTAAGRLTVTWRCSLIDCCVAGRPPPRSRLQPVTRPEGTVHIPGLSKNTVRQYDRGPPRPRHDPHHITFRNHGGGCDSGAGSIINYPYQETR